MRLAAGPAQAGLLATVWLVLCTAGVDGWEPEDHQPISAAEAPADSDLLVDAETDSVLGPEGPDSIEIEDVTDGGTPAELRPPNPERTHTATRPARRVRLRVTAYCDSGLTAAGVPSGVGQCAAPAGIPFGSRIYIPKLNRSFVVTDRTAARFRSNTVDLFMTNAPACVRFGRHYLDCFVTPPPAPMAYGSAALHRAVRSRS